MVQIPKALTCILKADSVKHLMKLQMEEAQHSIRLMSSVTFTSMYCERLLRTLNKEMKPSQNKLRVKIWPHFMSNDSLSSWQFIYKNPLIKPFNVFTTAVVQNGRKTTEERVIQLFHQYFVIILKLEVQMRRGAALMECNQIIICRMSSVRWTFKMLQFAKKQQK